ncbi:hypothetical protein TEA_008040 [Camellia sinensis var. sinensis]|uniref:Uncharacterized protein n=1 Tax=Camellia sinensis var. sinensis TaxID=542762 RepID=A0A4S4DG00_CAMSN|nr:hypothetical protein TEA_008040 [Camellia sinensis var. sinensis]
MPLPFDFQGKGLLDSSSSSYSCSSLPPFSNPLLKYKESCFLGSEPTSVLDTIGSPSPPTSTSTLSSSLGGGGGGGGVAAVSGNSSHKWPPNSNVGVESASLEITTTAGAAVTAEKCGLGMEDWESLLSESAAASPSQEQSVIRWIMGDVDDPSMGLNKLLQSGGGGAQPPEFEFHGGFGVVDQGFGLDMVSSVGNFMGSINPSLPTSGFSQEKLSLPPNTPILTNYKLPNPQNPNLFSPGLFNPPQQCQQQQPPLECSDVKPQIFNPPLLINHHQAHHTQNPSFFLPFPHTHQEHHLMPPQKRHNPGGGGLEQISKGPFSDSMLHQQPQGLSHQLQLLPNYLQQRPTMSMKPKFEAADEMGQQQQGIIDQLFKAAELVQTGNSVLAQSILARLNHQLSAIGKPFHRAAFLCKEALQLLITNPSAANSPFNLIFKIAAYKSFSEISPLLQFANFTCNQALLEALDGFDRIHIVDFDIGYGGQWASLMQELALRSTGAPSLKITAFASPSTHDQLELGLTRENLNHFASEINMAFEFDILSLDSLHSASSWSLPIHVSENEAIAVNLPIGSFSNYQLSLPLIVRFVKQLSPKIVVSVDRGCDRTDLPFPNHVIHALQSYSNLLESLDAVNVNLDALQKIERFLLQPGIEKIVMGRYRSPEKTLHWRTLFLSSGFSPLTFSNFTESQAECVVKRTPVRGFHVEKRPSSLLLCWQQKELISASAWRC